MEYIPIGQIIKSLRKQMGFTQKELSEDICTQALISKIENNNEIPSSLILFQIARKLNVDMNYFFNQKSNAGYADDLISIIRQHIRDRNYVEVYEIVQKEMNSPQFIHDPYIKQFLLWHEGICLFHLNNDFEKAIDKLVAALHITGHINKQLTEREIEIVNSMAIFHNERKLYEESIHYYRLALSNISKIPQLKDIRIYIRILYGLSKSYKSIEQYHESLKVTRKGINLCKKYETFYLYGELEYQMGNNYVQLNNERLAEKHFKKAIHIFKIEERKAFITQTEKNLNILYANGYVPQID